MGELDKISPTQRNKLLGALADAMQNAGDWTQSVERTQQMRAMSKLFGELIGIPGTQRTLNEMSYGGSLTTGTGMTTRIKDDAVDAGMFAAPFVGPTGRVANRAAMAAGRAGERYAERVVPQILERGGLPAQLMQDMAMGTRSPATVWQGSPHKYDAEQLVRLANGDTAYVGGKFNKLKVAPPGSTLIQDFPLGRLRSEAIGTGEGAQSYGHGLYMADAKDVAKTYVDPLYQARDATQIGGLPYDDFLNKSRETFQTTTMDRVLFSKAMNPAKSLSEAASNLAELKQLKPSYDFSRVDRMFQESQKLGVDFPSKGSLYKVDLPDEQIAKMLDWDKPLSQQARSVQDARARMLGVRGEDFQKFMQLDPDKFDLTGQQLMQGKYLKGMSNSEGVVIRGEEALRKAGIPGIKYLDQGSRSPPIYNLSERQSDLVRLIKAQANPPTIGTKEFLRMNGEQIDKLKQEITTYPKPTSNYVVFPGGEDMLTILERNGGLLTPN